MPVDSAWREYIAAAHRFATASDRLIDRLRALVGDPPSEPRSMSPRDTAVWLELTVEVEEAARVQRQALDAFVNARRMSPLDPHAH